MCAKLFLVAVDVNVSVVLQKHLKAYFCVKWYAIFSQIPLGVAAIVLFLN